MCTTGTPEIHNQQCLSERFNGKCSLTMKTDVLLCWTQEMPQSKETDGRSANQTHNSSFYRTSLCSCKQRSWGFWPLVKWYCLFCQKCLGWEESSTFLSDLQTRPLIWTHSSRSILTSLSERNVVVLYPSTSRRCVLEICVGQQTSGAQSILCKIQWSSWTFGFIDFCLDQRQTCLVRSQWGPLSSTVLRLCLLFLYFFFFFFLKFSTVDFVRFFR